MANVKKNMAYQICYRLLTIITPLITAPVLSRALGAEALGTYSATLAFETYFSLIALLGIENYGSRSIATVQDNRKERQHLFWNIYAVQAIASVIAIALYGISITLVNQDRVQICLLQGAWLISNLLDINWFFFGCEEFKKTVTRNFAVKIVTVVCICAFIRNTSDLNLYTIIMSGSAVVSQLLMWGYLRKYVDFEKPRFEELKRHFVPILRLFIPILAISVFHIMDKTMLDWLSDDINVGYYYSADKVINIPLGVITAISTVMLPRISNVIHNDSMDRVKELLNKSMELVVCLTSAVGFGIAAIAKEFVPMFFGPGFEPCIVLVYWFTPILFIKAFSSFVTSQYLIPACRDRLYTVAVSVGAFTNLVANYFLITRLEALGAVIGTLIAELAVLVVELVGLNGEMPFVKNFWHQMPYVIIGAVMTVIVRLAAGILPYTGIIQVFLLILVGAAVFTICCVLYWIANKNSIFNSLLRKMKRE